MRARAAKALGGVVLTSVISIVSCGGDDPPGAPQPQGSAGETEGGSDGSSGAASGGTKSNEGGSDGQGAAAPSGGDANLGGMGQAGDVGTAGAMTVGGAGASSTGGADGVAGDGPMTAAGAGGSGNVEPPDLIVETGGPWPDSFTGRCASPSAFIPCPPSEGAFFGQDGTYRINVPSYATTVSTATDSITSLMWQLKPAGGGKSQADAVAYCDELSLAGHDDWRLPTRLEYVTLLDEGLPNGFAVPPAIPNDSTGTHWTQSASATSESTFFIVDDEHGLLTVASAGTFLARCVRGPALTGTLAVGADSTVDSMTSLEWQTTELVDTAVSWSDALEYCEGLEHADKSDWRLPSIKELVTLIDETAAVAPVVDTTAFGNASATRFWSSTPASTFSQEKVAFTVETSFGATPTVSMTDLSAARCVRSADQ
jgi:hypothetical protein